MPTDTKEKMSYGNSVTGRIAKIKQPYGGYIRLSAFDKKNMDDGIILHEKENVHGTIIGLVVDYMTRFMMGTDIKEAFDVSLYGAKFAQTFTKEEIFADAVMLLIRIKGLDEQSIINACKLVTFDIWKRNPFGAAKAINYKEMNPDKDTIENIITMIKRSIKFFEEYGPVVKDGFNFEPVNATMDDYMKMMNSKEGSFGGYTAVVSSGDGDFLTKDTLWDFKVIKNNPQSKDTLQILMYWIMGQHSGQECFKTIDNIGFFNPRSNIIYTRNIKTIPDEIIKIVENDVICY